jgi:transcriptional regulator with PAS, ATPase and Fis domain
LYYRLNTVPVYVPTLRERKEDIVLLFRKFAYDFAEKYRMPSLRLDDDARHILVSFPWPGNIRQLKNITEQVSIIEKERNIDGVLLRGYLPHFHEKQLPALYDKESNETFSSEREILYKVLFDMKKDMTDLKKLVFDLMHTDSDDPRLHTENANIIRKLYKEDAIVPEPTEFEQSAQQYAAKPVSPAATIRGDEDIQDTEEYVEESLSIEKKEKELIQKALVKHNGKRKYAAGDLGISERTLYRKIKEYNIN